MRKRLSSYSCTLCIDNCCGTALYEKDGDIVFKPSSCSSCGKCTAICPGEVFVYEEWDIHHMLNDIPETGNILISCVQDKHTHQNVLRVPCLGVFTAEALLFLALKVRATIHFNATKCPGCENQRAAESFSAMFHQQQQLLGHLFRGELQILHEAGRLSTITAQDRRSFLFNLGSSLSAIFRNNFPKRIKNGEPNHRKARQVPARTRLLLNLIAGETSFRDELVATCLPQLSISPSCSFCPRCSGICPSGALKVHRRNDTKSISFQAYLCNACGLCAEFCKEGAITIQNAPYLPSS